MNAVRTLSAFAGGGQVQRIGGEREGGQVREGRGMEGKRR